MARPARLNQPFLWPCLYQIQSVAHDILGAPLVRLQLFGFSSTCLDTPAEMLQAPELEGRHLPSLIILEK